MADADHTTDYRWLVVRRTKVQELVFDAYDTLLRNREPLQSNDSWRSIYALIVGAAFSLWRAVFLIVDARRDAERILDATEKFLEAVVLNNAITYQDDRRSNTWTAGYYLNNATYRMRRVIEKLQELNVSPGIQEADAFDRLKGLLGEGIGRRPTLVEEFDIVYDGVNSALKTLVRVIERSGQPKAE